MVCLKIENFSSSHPIQGKPFLSLVTSFIFCIATLYAPGIASQPYKAGFNSGYAMDELNLTGTGLYDDETSSVSILLYPNPVQRGHEFTLEVHGVTNSLVHINIFDLQGRKIFDQEMQPGTINLETLQPGTYIVQVSGQSDIYQSKLMVKPSP